MMGLKNAPSTWQRAIDSVCAGIRNTKIYIDDVMQGAKTFEEYVEHCVVPLCETVVATNLTLKPSKTHFGVSRIIFCSLTITSEGIQISDKSKNAITNFPHPNAPGLTIKQRLTRVHGIRGIGNYFRSHIPHWAKVEAPLRELCVEGAPFVWSAACAVGLMVMIERCQRLDPGSIPGRRTSFEPRISV